MLKKGIGVLISTLDRVPGSRAFFWLLARRFIAGEKVEDALTENRQLNNLGFHAILDYVGEGSRSREAIEDAVENYERLAEGIKESGLLADVSLKPSHFGITEPHHFHSFITRLSHPELGFILSRLDAFGIKMWLDAELLKTRNAQWVFTGWCLTKMRFKFLGCALQAYGDGPYDSEIFLTEEILPFLQDLPAGQTLGIRLCKGAYDELHTLKDANAIRRKYFRIAKILVEFVATGLKRGRRPPIFIEFATHDKRLIVTIKRLLKAYGIPPQHFRFALLYGVEEELASHLAAEGYPAAIYIPAGPEWFMYFGRRVQERPSYLLFLFTRKGKYHRCPEWPYRCVLKA